MFLARTMQTYNCDLKTDLWLSRLGATGGVSVGPQPRGSLGPGYRGRGPYVFIKVVQQQD